MTLVGYVVETSHLSITAGIVQSIEISELLCPPLALSTSHPTASVHLFVVDGLSLRDIQHVLVQLLQVSCLQVVVHQLGDRAVASAFVSIAADSALGLQTVTVRLERSAEVLVHSD